MRRFAKIIVAAGIALAGLAYLAAGPRADPAAPQTVQGGERPLAPDFSLADIFRTPLSLEQYRGKVVLLDFWATWCGSCRLEIPGLIGLEKQYGDKGLQVIGISEDQGGAATVAQFYRQFGLNYRVAIDAGQLSLLYGGVAALPTTFLIGRDGRIYAKVVGAVEATELEAGIKALLAASPGAKVKNFPPLRYSEAAEVETAAEANSVVPGVDVSGFTKAQLAKYESALAAEQCTCGCGVNLLVCRKSDPGCDISLRKARELAKHSQ